MSDAHTDWEVYKARALREVAPLLFELGYQLEERQPHIQGERFLMRAVTTAHGKKLVLLGERISDKKRVVIKVTDDPKGKAEIEHERTCKEVLHTIRFAYETFSSPEELLYTRKGAYVFYIQTFLEHEKPFLERPLKEQFDLALTTFKAQEGARATTYGHHRLIERTFGHLDSSEYVKLVSTFSTYITNTLPEEDELADTLARGEAYLKKHKKTIEQYTDFLVHTDFVPHNFRVVRGVIYLLDHSSLRFGNKYEGWARFLNFMTLYNPELAEALTTYVAQNRSEGEAQSLRLMCIYRLGEILSYYTSTLNESEGALRELNTARIHFWHTVLKAILEEKTLDPHVRETYTQKRDELRSEEEKERQVGLH